jgi:hypothetical protein
VWYPESSGISLEAVASDLNEWQEREDVIPWERVQQEGLLAKI